MAQRACNTTLEQFDFVPMTRFQYGGRGNDPFGRNWLTRDRKEDGAKSCDKDVPKRVEPGFHCKR